MSKDEMQEWLKKRKLECLVAQYVMGWKPKPARGQEDWEAYLWEYPTGESCLRDDPDGVPYYARSMDAAWLVVRMMNNPDSPAFPDYQDYARFIDTLTEIVGSDLFFDLFYCDKDGDHLTPERICIAALKAVGCEMPW